MIELVPALSQVPLAAVYTDLVTIRVSEVGLIVTVELATVPPTLVTWRLKVSGPLLAGDLKTGKLNVGLRVVAPVNVATGSPTATT
jgi:hypothetical protein